MDIILGASPEEGGVSCFDALMCNKPYIVYAANSTCLSSTYILNRLGLEKWLAYSTIDLLSTVRAELHNIKAGKIYQLSEKCLTLSEGFMNAYINAVLQGVESSFKEINNQK